MPRPLPWLPLVGAIVLKSGALVCKIPGAQIFGFENHKSECFMIHLWMTDPLTCNAIFCCIATSNRENCRHGQSQTRCSKSKMSPRFLWCVALNDLDFIFFINKFFLPWFLDDLDRRTRTTRYTTNYCFNYHKFNRFLDLLWKRFGGDIVSDGEVRTSIRSSVFFEWSKVLARSGS